MIEHDLRGRLTRENFRNACTRGGDHNEQNYGAGERDLARPYGHFNNSESNIPTARNEEKKKKEEKAS